MATVSNKRHLSSHFRMDFMTTNWWLAALKVPNRFCFKFSESAEIRCIKKTTLALTSGINVIPSVGQLHRRSETAELDGR